MFLVLFVEASSPSVLYDLHQLDIEDDGSWVAAVGSVVLILWNPKPHHVPFDHQLYTFGERVELGTAEGHLATVPARSVGLGTGDEAALGRPPRIRQLNPTRVGGPSPRRLVAPRRPGQMP